MSITHNANHEADVRVELGIKAADGSARLAGIEIETGWTSEAKRSAFLKGLEKRGYGDKCISKHDGTIGRRNETFPAEIVSVPLPFDELRKFAVAVGEEIEERADKGLITMGSGVHIHVSEGLFDSDTLWRYAASLCQSVDMTTTWIKALGITDARYDEMLKDSETLHKFWDAICLRGATDYSRRNPYERVSQIPKTRDHKRAFIHGKNSPTFETRIFRTPKSRRVLASYVDSVKSLYDFASLGASADLLEAALQSDSRLIEQLQMETYPALSSGFDNSGNPIFYNTLNGEQFRSDEIVPVISRRFGQYYFPIARTLRGRNKRVPTIEELDLIMAGTEGKGARGWAEGILPLREYLKFVLSSDKYPDLVKRLGFSKFSPFISGEFKGSIEHRAQEHLEFQKGCLARIEGGKGELYSLIDEGTLTKDGIRNWIVQDEVTKRRTNCSINLLVHACKGAVEAGGEV